MANPQPDHLGRILLVSTTGGFTHAAPVLELGAVLAARGYEVQFATQAGQESWTASYPFITTIHIVSPAVPTAEANAHYVSMRDWRPEHSIGPMMQSKRLFDSYWPDTYRKLTELCRDGATTKPDFIVADFFSEAAARDVLRQFGIQIAVVWPQMPYYMAPASYIPGQPGFQVGANLTSEHASLASRFASELVLVRCLPELFSWLRWTKSMRADAGVSYSLEPQVKPDYLVLVNSFFGLEVPKDLPPLIVPVGPILGDSYSPLTHDLSTFLEHHDKTLYASLGTHICIPAPEFEKLLLGLVEALDTGYINGVIWSVPNRIRTQLDPSRVLTRSNGSTLTLSSLLNDSHAQFRLPTFAPQRAVLAHPSTRLFLTHGGGSSANETLFHGVPTLSIGYFFDQLCNSVRLQGAGVGITLDKSTFTTQEVCKSIGDILKDADGMFSQNVQRMQRIARIASRRKHLAADLIEEVMCDHELRHRDDVPVRPMHLQTADMRMPAWKARNWDMWLVSLTSVAIGGIAGWWFLKNGLKRLPNLMSFSRWLARDFIGTVFVRHLKR